MCRKQSKSLGWHMGIRAGRASECNGKPVAQFGMKAGRIRTYELPERRH